MNFCPNCGQPVDPSTGICPVCSSGADEGFALKLKNRLNSPLLLAFCIIITLSPLFAAAAMAIEGSFMGRFAADEFDFASIDPNLEIIIVVVAIAFLVFSLFATAYAIIQIISFWRIYRAAKAPEDTMDLGGLKTIKTLISIVKGLLWTITGLLIAFFVLCLIECFSPDREEWIEFSPELAAIFLFIYIAILLVFNIFFYGSIKKSIGSLIESFKYNENRLKKLNTVMVWLIVLGVFGVMSMFSYISARESLYNLSYVNGGLPTEIAVNGSPVTRILGYISAVLSVSLYFIGAALAYRLNLPSRQPPFYIQQNNN